ncbi:MAG TPA: hypothetical protein VN258_06225 [Mobilitalea sp.]|nr:hypothetical protein [Mobilitalea sp.]
MDWRTVIAIVISLAIIMPIVFICIEKVDQKDKAKNNTGASLYIKKAKTNPLYWIYKIFCRIPLTRSYLLKISSNYELICPGNPRAIANKTMLLAGTTLLLCIAEIALTFLLEPDMNNLILAVYLIFVINNEVINYFVRKSVITLLEEMERFISNVSHNYFINYYIDDAIVDAIDNRMSEEMKINAKIIYEIVTSDSQKEDVARYNATTHNKYLKMFLSLCINVMENGDKIHHGQRLMTQNLISLKKEINLEYLKQKKLNYIFSGSIFAAVAVCIPLTLIQKFGISIAPQLEAIYLGQLGILYVVLIFLISSVVYIMINNAKEMKKPMVHNNIFLEKLEKLRFINTALDNFAEKHYGPIIRLRDTLKRLGECITPKQLLLKSIITSFLAFSISIILMFYIHSSNKALLTEKVINEENLTSVGMIELTEVMKEEILRYVNKYKEEAVTQEQIQLQLQKEGSLYNQSAIEEVAKEVIERINRYQNEYFKWYELLICIGIGLLCFIIPYLMILYRRKLLAATMEDEVIQFNSIIYMMMYSDHVTVMDLLEQMELFAMVFRPTLRECMNEYNSGDIQALEKMKKREAFEPFIRLVDNLIRCDDISIENSFDEIASDRENYYDRRKLENEIIIQKRADNIKPLAFLPGIMVLIYLILPLLYISIKSLLDLKEMIQSMGIY